MKLDSRYCTDQAKEQILVSWNKQKSSAISSGRRGDDGLPDAEIVPLCDDLNSFDGVCTLQSCAGHKKPAFPPNLWLWLSESMSKELDRLGHVLANMDGIEQVEKRFTRWGQEIVVITLDNRDRGADSLVIFFRSIS